MTKLRKLTAGDKKKNADLFTYEVAFARRVKNISKMNIISFL